MAYQVCDDAISNENMASNSVSILELWPLWHFWSFVYFEVVFFCFLNSTHYFTICELLLGKDALYIGTMSVMD